MKYKFIFTILLFVLLSNNIAQAGTTYFLNFKQILNESDAGKKAQNFLKKIGNRPKRYKDKEKSILDEEKNNKSKKCFVT